MSDSGFRYPAMRGVFTDDRARSAELLRPVEKSVEIDLPDPLTPNATGK
jgi:hypothetical protein